MSDTLDYTDGTITLTQGSSDFTTVGSALVAVDIRAGDTILIKGWSAVIASITGQNSGTLAEPWAQATQTDEPLRIRRAPIVSRLTAFVQNLLQRLDNGNLEALAALNLVGDQMIYSNGPGSLTTGPFKDFAKSFLGSVDSAAALDALGATDIGKLLIAAANAGAAQDAIGASATGKAVLTAANQGAAQDAVGATVVGKALIIAVDQAAGRAAIAAQQQDDQLSAIAALTGLGGAFIRWTGASSAVMQAIRGQCSQTDSVPTGALFEFFSNANGDCLRSAGGAQICYSRLNFGGTGAGIRTVNWTYPAAFAHDPILLGSPEGFGEAFRFVGISGPGKPGPTVAAASIEVTSAGAGTVICQVATIGRWF
jgi:hypothetical protein